MARIPVMFSGKSNSSDSGIPQIPHAGSSFQALSPICTQSAACLSQWALFANT